MPVAPDDPRLDKCGFARLFGNGGKLDYVMRKYEILLGRPNKSKPVDVPADYKSVSREHAYIRYNFEKSEHGRWGALGPPPGAGGGWQAAGGGACRPLGRPPPPPLHDERHPSHRPASRPALHPLQPYTTHSPRPSSEGFELEVLGKIGVKVDGQELRPDPQGGGPIVVPLASQCLLQVGWGPDLHAAACLCCRCYLRKQASQSSPAPDTVVLLLLFLLLLQVGEELSFYFLLPKSPREVVAAGSKRR